MDGEDLEGTDDIGFGEPGPSPGTFDERYGVVDADVTEGEVFTGY